jgi:hypothetical protein
MGYEIWGFHSGSQSSYFQWPHLKVTNIFRGWSAQNKALFTRKLNPAKKTVIKHSLQAKVKLEEKIILCMIWGSHSGGYHVFYFLGYNAM